MERDVINDEQEQVRDLVNGGNEVQTDENVNSGEPTENKKKSRGGGVPFIGKHEMFKGYFGFTRYNRTRAWSNDFC